MRMLNVFPELLFLAPIAALLIRAATASFFILAGITHWKYSDNTSDNTVGKIFAAMETAVAIALAVGFYTQIAALIAACVIVAWFFMKDMRPLPMSTMLLLLVTSFSLILTGSGPISFDLPL